MDEFNSIKLNRIKLTLDKYFIFEPNNSKTRKLFEDMVPGVICNDILNNPTVVDTHCLRFILDGKVYEYNGVELTEIYNAGNAAELKKLFDKTMYDQNFNDGILE